MHIPKFITTFSAIALSTSAVMAQHSLALKLLHKSTAASYQPHCGNTTASKATATGSRLIKEVNLQSDGTSQAPTDSAIYAYSGSRGGDLDHILKFDAGTLYFYNSPLYVNGYAATQTFDANNNIKTLLLKTWQLPLGPWINSDSAYLQYDANNNLLKTTMMAWDDVNSQWLFSSRDSSTYDVNNNELSHAWQNYNSATQAWENSEYDTYTYTAGNKLESTLVLNWSTFLNDWDTVNYLTNTYDANDNMTLFISQYYDAFNHVWVLNSKDTFTYDASNNRLTDLTCFWNTDSLKWLNNSLVNYSNFSGNSPQSELTQLWNDTSATFVNAQRKTNAYNANEQLTSFYTQTWDGSNWITETYDYGGRYYYESYSLHISPVATLGGKATIYPVPAGNEITVNVNWNEPQQGTISIISMNGNTVRRCALAMASDAKQTINVSDLPAGNYLVNIMGTKGNIVQQLTIAR